MLRDGIASAKINRKFTTRMMAQEMGMKQPCSISGMANGRMMIPIKRIEELVALVDLDFGPFLLAVLEQHGAPIERLSVLP